MDPGALFIGGFMLFASGVVLASVVAALDMKKLKAERDEAMDGWKKVAAFARTTSDQLEATRIALREAQKNDHRDAVTGEYVKAS